MSVPDKQLEPQSDSELEETGLRLLRRRRLRSLPVWLKVLVLLAGWIVVLIGIAGLVLPGPGIATIVVGAAILSVVSEAAYGLTRKSLKRWPSIWDRVESFRDRLHDRLHDFVHKNKKK